MGRKIEFLAMLAETDCHCRTLGFARTADANELQSLGIVEDEEVESNENLRLLSIAWNAHEDAPPMHRCIFRFPRPYLYWASSSTDDRHQVELPRRNDVVCGCHE